MGVPVVTKLGNGLSSRLGGAILSAINMSDWFATTSPCDRPRTG
jgi:predicted O-linked N-acetylglucosamine transferase (SPINDLY family)